MIINHSFSQRKVHVRPTVALNATLVRSSSNFHKSCFVMWLNFCESLRKIGQLEGFFFFRRPETSRNSLFAREFSALFECCSASSSCLRVLLALRARCDHVFTSLIKKRSTLHVLPILSARRGCPHSQSQSATVEGVCCGCGARRVCRVCVFYLHCEHAVIMFSLY